MSIISNGKAQAIFVNKEFCKKWEVELMTNCDLPRNFVIVGTSTFLKTHELMSLNDLSIKQVKRMRSFARRMKSCHVIVDFKGDLIPTIDKDGNPVSDTHSSYYVLRESFTVGSKTN